jgi:hypothetical protein
MSVKTSLKIPSKYQDIGMMFISINNGLELLLSSR